MLSSREELPEKAGVDELSLCENPTERTVFPSLRFLGQPTRVCPLTGTVRLLIRRSKNQ